MHVDEQPPLRLEQLADVESPDVVRAALARFRRRSARRVAAAAILILVWPVLLRGLDTDRPTIWEKIQRAETIWIGRTVSGRSTTVAVLDARRLLPGDRPAQVTVRAEPGLPPPPPPPPFDLESHERFLHVTVTSSAIGPDEDLAIGDPFVGPGGYTPQGMNAAEAWFAIVPGQRTLDVMVVALAAYSGNEARGPGSHTPEQCALPLNSLGVCEFLKAEGRFIETITLDLVALVPDKIRGA